MTPTEQDNELREKISHRFDSVCAEGHQQSCGEYQTAVDDIMQLITADRKRVALEARIDELNGLPIRILARYQLSNQNGVLEGDVAHRIVELKQELEKL